MLPNRRPVNMVFQHLALFPMMSVGENVGYGLARRGVARSEIATRVDAMLKRVGLPGAQDKRVDQLSGGQRQRVAIARSLVLEPTLLLLDEPLGALDLKLREHMKIELKQLQAAFGTTFVYITHDQSEALVLSDHVAVMNAGRFEQVGTPQELYYQPRTPFVAGFVGANNRMAGKAVRVDGDDGRNDDGRRSRGRARATSGTIAAGDAVEAFVRPEVVDPGARRGELPAAAQRFAGTVESLLFDGANSAVLVREQTVERRDPHRAAADRALRRSAASARRSPSASIAQRAVCFRAGEPWRLSRQLRTQHRQRRARSSRCCSLLAPALIWLVGLIVIPHVELAILSLRARVAPRVYECQPRPVPHVLRRAAVLAHVRAHRA